MKKILNILFALIFVTSVSCKTDASGSAKKENVNYRAEMRSFVKKISETARKTDSNFIVIPQNGQNVAWDDDENPDPDDSFFDAIDGTGREDTFYGYEDDGKLTPEEAGNEFLTNCDLYKSKGKTVLSIDYTKSDATKISDSNSKNYEKGYISFAAPERNLTVIPDYEPFNKNSDDVNSLSDAKNFLYLILPDITYSSKSDFLNAVKETDYDALIIDLYFTDEEQLTSEDVESLKTKKSGGKRLVICYMSIGEAENYRFYWKSGWKKGKPSFVCAENPEWGGNYKVKYWNADWQNIICGEDSSSYLSKILSSGFDGVYLDIIDAYEYFESE